MPLPSKGTLGYLAARTYLRMRQKGPSALRMKVGPDRPFLPGSTVTTQLGTWPSGDVERIRHKALKTSSAPRDQGIAAKDNGGAESIADARQGEGAAWSGGLHFGQVQRHRRGWNPPFDPDLFLFCFFLVSQTREWGGQDSHRNLCDPKPTPLTLHQTASRKTTADTESLSVKDGEKQRNRN